MKRSARVLLLLVVVWTMVQAVPNSCTIPGQTPQFYYEGMSANTTTSQVIIRTPVVPDTAVLLDQVVMITQVQAGSINNQNNANYGSGSGGGGNGARENDAGFYEFNVIESASCSASDCTLTMQFPLTRAWQSGIWIDDEDGGVYQRSFQVVHALVCDHVTINGNYQIPTYEGGAGGVLAIIANELNWSSGTLDATGRGHAGGPDRNEWTNANGPYPYISLTNPATLQCARKGSGFIGHSNSSSHPNTYPGGMDGGIGAPGNAGGGGCRGGGGGGGANGGKGGYGGNPPGRGHGGDRTIPAPVLDRLFFGGSGGAGHRNTNSGAVDMSRGWSGGGIIYIHTRTVNEAFGRAESRGRMPEFGVLDSPNGGGGGGAGGTVVLLSESETASNWEAMTVVVQGGAGTRAAINKVGGGGGGGGIVMSTASTFEQISLDGGAYGGPDLTPQADGEGGMVTFNMPAASFPSQRIVEAYFLPPGATPTSSASISVTPSPSASVSLSFSASASRTTTPSASSSVSISMSSSASQSTTATDTPSASVSISMTLSASASPTITATLSASSSTTISASASASVSTTPSASRTTTPSSSASPTTTATRSASSSTTTTATFSTSSSSSISVSPSASRTTTPSASASPSISMSSSASRSRTPSASASSTSTTTLSASSSTTTTATSSASPSVSRSASISTSPSSTGTSSASSTASLSVGASVSGTPTPSASASVTNSVTPSASSSASTTTTPSSSASISTTATASASVSVSTTPSSSVSNSGTPSASGSTTSTATASPSTSATSTGSDSPSASISHTASPSASASATSTNTASASVSLSNTRTASTSISISTTPSPSQSVGASRSPTSTVSPTTTETTTPSPSVSTSSTNTPSSSSSVSPSLTLSVTASESQITGPVGRSPSPSPIAPVLLPTRTASPTRTTVPSSAAPLAVESYSSCVVCESGQATFDISVARLQPEHHLELWTASGRAGSLIIPGGLSASGYVLDVEFVRDTQGEGNTLDGVGSTVISVVLEDQWGEPITQLDEPLSICLEETSLSGVPYKDMCLAFWDEERQAWCCQDHRLHRTDDGQLCGETPHLTNFALLFSPEEGSSDGWDHVIGWLTLGFACGAVLVVAFSTLVIEGWYRYQQQYRRHRIRLLTRISQSENQQIL